MIFPHSVISPFPCGEPMRGNLSLFSFADKSARSEKRAVSASVAPYDSEPPLDDVVRVETRAVRVVSVRVHGEFFAEHFHAIVVPSPFLSVFIDIFFAIFCRRKRNAGLFEKLFVAIQI